MNHPSAAHHAAPQAARSSQVPAERDTLEAIDDDFLRDQLEALLASPTLSRVADRHSEGHDQPTDFDGGALAFERDTEPSIDVKLVREALNAGSK